METLIADIAHGIGYEIRQLKDKEVQESSWLDGYHKGKKTVARRMLRKILKVNPQFRRVAQKAFNGSWKFDLSAI